jgi:MFS family permease
MFSRLNRADVHAWRRHGPLVLTSMIGVGFSTIHVYSQGTFMPVLERELGWSRAQFAAGPLIYSLLTTFTAMIGGMMADRFGPRRIALSGLLAFSLCFGALAFTRGAVWQWYAGWIALAFSFPLISPTIWSAAVASRFTTTRGFALAATLAGTGVGSFVTPILVNYLIEHYGWRLSYVLMPTLWLTLLLPLTCVFFFGARDREPAGKAQTKRVDKAELPGLDFRSGYRSTYLLRIGLACFAFTFSLLGMMVQFVPIVTARGLDRDSAAASAGIIGLTSIVGRLVAGSLLDRLHAPHVGGIAFLIPLGAVFILANFDGSVLPAVLAAVIIGLSLGAELDVVAYLITRYLGMRHFGTFFGTIMGLASLATGGGSLAAALIYDRTHSYTLLFPLVAPLFIFSASLIASLGPYPCLTSKSECPGDVSLPDSR